MSKLFYGLAVVAVVIAFMDLQAPPGSRAAMEGGLLLLLAPVLALLGFWLGRRASRVCPKCAERVRREAKRCKHCGADIA